MTRRLRALLDRPLEPDVARAVVSLALVATVGLASLFCLAAREGGSGTSRHQAVAPPADAVRPASIVRAPVRVGSWEGRRQDRQDRPGTAAHRRAERQLVTHRALQHVPWRGDGVSIALVGARGDEAVLAVRAPNLGEARHGYRLFLRRHRDDGRAYLPLFRPSIGARATTTEAHLQATPEAHHRARLRATPDPARTADSPHGTAGSRARNLPRSLRHSKVDR